MPVEAYEYRIQEIRRRIKELDSVMTDDVNKFEKILQEQVRLTIEGEALLIVKKVISKVFIRIVMRTPVDTGRARASMAIRRRNGTIGGCSGQRVSRTQR